MTKPMDRMDRTTFLYDVPPSLIEHLCKIIDSGDDQFGWRGLGEGRLTGVCSRTWWWWTFFEMNVVQTIHRKKKKKVDSNFSVFLLHVGEAVLAHARGKKSP